MRLHYSLLVTLTAATGTRQSGSADSADCSAERQRRYKRSAAQEKRSANAERRRRHQIMDPRERKPGTADSNIDHAAASSSSEQLDEQTQRIRNFEEFHTECKQFYFKKSSKKSCTLSKWDSMDPHNFSGEELDLKKSKPIEAWIYAQDGHTMIYVRWQGLADGFDTYGYDWQGGSQLRVQVRGAPGQMKKGATEPEDRHYDPAKDGRCKLLLHHKQDDGKPFYDDSFSNFHQPNENGFLWKYLMIGELRHGYCSFTSSKKKNCIDFVKDLCNEFNIPFKKCKTTWMSFCCCLE